MKSLRLFLFLTISLIITTSNVFASDCTAVFYKILYSSTNISTAADSYNFYTINTETGAVSNQSQLLPAGTSYLKVTWALWSFNGTAWTQLSSSYTNQFITNPTAAFGGVYSKSVSSIDQATILAAMPSCPNICGSKSGTSAGYLTTTLPQGEVTPDLSDQCYKGCKVSGKVVDSIGAFVNSSVLTNIQYTYTGESCESGDTIPGLTDEDSGLCHAEWIAIINKCGGVKNVGTFDWGSCTGECAKTDCSQEWANLSERCG
ncbi:MAG: hypothetical protein PHP53_24355, partial [Prolixibacteraceae bacterium]|nr:hypothetical protein [Prolixibacteraceae bacterium]